MLVLGIESSCDETAAALYHSERGLLAHHLYSQVALHAQYGGVVPELASRDHIRKTLPLIQQSLNTAKVTQADINGVAYTKGPGLVGALMVGASIGRSLGYAWQVPVLGVHHMEAHLMAVMLEPNPPEFPFIALIVSGGHTLLVSVTGLGEYELLGETLDDAVGEAFDKTAKLLGLGYPGGAALAELAEEGQPGRFEFPRPMIHHPDLNFSFSGIKTFALNCVKQYGKDRQTCADLAYAFEEAIVDTLLIKSRRALEQTGLNRLVVAGGVSANKKLRAVFHQTIKSQGGEVFYPRPEFCTDNAAMVAYTGCLRLARGESNGLSIEVKARWGIDELE